jgi:hypothetical protein
MEYRREPIPTSWTLPLHRIALASNHKTSRARDRSCRGVVDKLLLLDFGLIRDLPDNYLCHGESEDFYKEICVRNRKDLNLQCFCCTTLLGVIFMEWCFRECYANELLTAT